MTILMAFLHAAWNRPHGFWAEKRLPRKRRKLWLIEATEEYNDALQNAIRRWFGKNINGTFFHKYSELVLCWLKNIIKILSLYSCDGIGDGIRVCDVAKGESYEAVVTIYNKWV